MIQGLRTVIYKVPDLAAAKAWYGRILGIEPYFAEPFYVGFQVGGFELGLDPDMGSVVPGGGVTAYWGVADADAALAEMLARGAQAARGGAGRRRRHPRRGGEGPLRQRVRRDREPALLDGERALIGSRPCASAWPPPTTCPP